MSQIRIIQFKQSWPILFSLRAKILQSHQLTQNSYWVHEMNLPTTFSWLAEKKWYEFSVSSIYWLMQHRIFDFSHNSRLIKWIQQKLFIKNQRLDQGWNLNHYTIIVSMLVKLLLNHIHAWVILSNSSNSSNSTKKQFILEKLDYVTYLWIASLSRRTREPLVKATNTRAFLCRTNTAANSS